MTQRMTNAKRLKWFIELQKTLDVKVSSYREADGLGGVVSVSAFDPQTHKVQFQGHAGTFWKALDKARRSQALHQIVAKENSHEP